MPKDLITTFREFVAREQLFSQYDELLLACSGGLDSTVLAHILHAEGYDFAIAHMNFQLRGEASDGDAAFVEELARTLDAKFYCKAVDVKGRAQPGESTQMTCRRLRYDWFLHLLDGEKYKWVLTAHHRDDDFETALINFIRGSGARGLAGMRLWRDNPLTLRPLLNLTGRAELLAYAHVHNLSWREDASNATDDYLRNRIRHQLTPVLADLFGLDASRWARTTKVRMNSEAELASAGYELLAEHYLKATTDNQQAAFLQNPGQWAPHHQEYYDTFVHRWLTDPGGWAFTDEQVRQLRRGVRRLKSKLYDLELRDDGGITIWRHIQQSPLVALTLKQLPFVCGELQLNLIPRPAVLNKPGRLYLTLPSGGGGLPLHLRPRKNGDRFQPLGLGGKTKKVKDYMIDAKIPVWLRDRIYLLTNDQDEIMAIPGYCISEKFKVRPEDELVLEIRTQHL